MDILSATIQILGKGERESHCEYEHAHERKCEHKHECKLHGHSLPNRLPFFSAMC